MNSYDITYCVNEKCDREDCRRHRSKLPSGFPVYTSEFKEKNCKYFLQGTPCRKDIEK